MAVLVVQPMSVEDAEKEVYAVNTSSCGANIGLSNDVNAETMF